MFFLQAALALVGIGIFLLGRLPVGQREVRNPLASLIGMVLIIPLPACVMLLSALCAGLASQYRRAVGLDDAYRLAMADYWWVRPAFTLVAVAVAGGLTWIGLKTQQDELPLPAAPVAPSEVLERASPALSASAAFTSSPAASQWVQSLAPEPPSVPPAVARYRSMPKCLPPEVEALGRAEKLFKPSAVGGVFAWWEGAATVAHLIFRDALVTMEGDDFIVIPWAVIKAVSGRRVTTDDGQTFELSGHVEGAARLLQVVRMRVHDRLMAAAQASLDAGESAEFGPLTATAGGLQYRGKSLAWFEVAHARTQTTENGPTLFITAGGTGLPWCMVPLEKVPNDFVLLELIGRLAPGALASSYTY